MDFQSECAENGLELMAKGIRTQPTSRNPIPTSQNIDFGTIYFSVFMFFVSFKLKTMFLNFYLNNLQRDQAR